MIGCLRTRVRKQPTITLYFELENKLNLITLRPGIHIWGPVFIDGAYKCMVCKGIERRMLLSSAEIFKKLFWSKSTNRSDCSPGSTLSASINQ